MKRVFQTLFFAVLALAFAQAIWHGAHLPERVATHFNTQGHADGWMTRSQHTAWLCGLMLFLGLFFSLLARYIHRVPDDFVNLPHKTHWLAASRRAETFAWISGLLYAVGIAVVIFFIFLFQRIYEVNITGSNQLGIRLLPMIVCQFIFIVSLVVCLLFRFRTPPPGPVTSKRSQRLRR